MHSLERTTGNFPTVGENTQCRGSVPRSRAEFVAFAQFWVPLRVQRVVIPHGIRPSKACRATYSLFPKQSVARFQRLTYSVARPFDLAFRVCLARGHPRSDTSGRRRERRKPELCSPFLLSWRRRAKIVALRPVPPTMRVSVTSAFFLPDPSWEWETWPRLYIFQDLFIIFWPVKIACLPRRSPLTANVSRSRRRPGQWPRLPLPATRPGLPGCKASWQRYEQYVMLYCYDFFVQLVLMIPF